MKKFLFVIAALVASVAMADAQNLKFGYVNYNEIIMLMPETDSARTNLSVAQKDADEIYQGMVEEYNIKLEQYQQKVGSWTPAVRESKERELAEMQQRINDYTSSIQMELNQMQQNLMAPIVQKAVEAVGRISKAQVLALVFDTTTLLYFDPAQGTDITKELKAELGELLAVEAQNRALPCAGCVEYIVVVLLQLLGGHILTHIAA